MPSLEQADPIVQRLSKGWIFERTLRIIFPSQMDLLVEASTSEYVGEKRALELYDRPTDPAVKSRSFQDFIGFLTNSQLLEVIFPSNIIGYAITGRGRQLLEFARQINGGVAWPMVPLDDSLPLETSVPSAES